MPGTAANCSEALIAALLVRRFNDAPTRIDTLHRLTVFIGAAVIAAPFLSSFADAASVAVFHNESYWQVWRARFLSNALTELVLVSAITVVASEGPRWLHGASLARVAETLIVSGGSRPLG
jgi:integral membrane sensor domain MASE1